MGGFAAVAGVEGGRGDGGGGGGEVRWLCKGLRGAGGRLRRPRGGVVTRALEVAGSCWMVLVWDEVKTGDKWI